MDCRLSREGMEGQHGWERWRKKRGNRAMQIISEINWDFWEFSLLARYPLFLNAPHFCRKQLILPGGGRSMLPPLFPWRTIIERCWPGPLGFPTRQDLVAKG